MLDYIEQQYKLHFGHKHFLSIKSVATAMSSCVSDPGNNQINTGYVPTYIEIESSCLKTWSALFFFKSALIHCEEET